MRLTSDTLFLSFVALVLLAVTAVMVGAHWNDDELRSKCEAAGGTFVHAKDPLHLCVKTVDQPIVHPK